MVWLLAASTRLFLIPFARPAEWQTLAPAVSDMFSEQQWGGVKLAQRNLPLIDDPAYTQSTKNNGAEQRNENNGQNGQGLDGMMHGHSYPVEVVSKQVLWTIPAYARALKMQARRKLQT